ncbi:tetratricopeptide repeat domain protein [Leptolyngbya sp. Heron Island J]|uniref:Sll0314/Alr1548 family TPR repeat-containing protein n=1 Tax=Leptolyngbya sp. Heron Island J TaxID=1385935 RepID=UPI0003B9F6FD|nr:Sll0314/Alr1548 family TPR repeat-containing protein [Leptolyngbya sp. Heron Island J]ESA36016.1 tetratricopeptide repeat domain protein [Leptolyngbya sp. Heron Island J]
MTFRALYSFLRPKSYVKFFGLLTAAALTVVATPVWAGDPFRSNSEHNIGPHAETAFESFFRAGDYVSARAALELAKASEADDPLVHSMAASMAYLDEDWDALDAEVALTRSTAETLLETDPLRGHIYSAVGIFMEGAHMMRTQGVARSTPAALAMLQQVFGHIGEAEKIDSTDPELNLVKGFMDLMLAVNLPFSDPEKAIERLSQYGNPEYIAYRGIALGYRDLGQMDDAMTAVEQALETAPENPELFYLKAQLHRRQQETDDSVAMFEKALEYAAQLPPNLARKIYKEKCRTLGGSHETCGIEARDFVDDLEK